MKKPSVFCEALFKLLWESALFDFDLDTSRTRLRKMSDEELRDFGNAARYMVSPTANMGKPPLLTFELQLQEARAEWRRRHLQPRRGMQKLPNVVKAS